VIACPHAAALLAVVCVLATGVHCRFTSSMSSSCDSTKLLLQGHIWTAGLHSQVTVAEGLQQQKSSGSSSSSGK
jgi:hypothetical protein